MLSGCSTPGVAQEEKQKSVGERNRELSIRGLAWKKLGRACITLLALVAGEFGHFPKNHPIWCRYTSANRPLQWTFPILRFLHHEIL